jgi:hypothetical protein
MPEKSLSDAELKDFEAALNRFDPVLVRGVLDDVGVAPLPGEGTDATASGPLDFGSIPAGALVYRTETGQLRLRLTVTQITGASYEEFELTDAHFATLVRAAIERLEGRS